ncbi:MAG TPA: hypothetical protein VKP69_28960, partial [Isosphaeraceae bacterium]|nr:hypothetical protein [Isosphaeraceae bacterium]
MRIAIPVFCSNATSTAAVIRGAHRFLLENKEPGNGTAAAHPRPAQEEPTQFLVAEQFRLRENNCCCRTTHGPEVEARQAKAREREERDRIQAYWEALPPERRAALEAEALAGPDPEARAAYEAASSPARRLLQVGL